MLNPCKNHFESFQNTAFSMANLDVTLLHGFRPGGWGPTVRRFKEVALPGTLPTFRGWWCYKKRRENERTIFQKTMNKLFKSDWTHTHMSHIYIYVYNYIYIYVYIYMCIYIHIFTYIYIITGVLIIICVCVCLTVILVLIPVFSSWMIAIHKPSTATEVSSNVQTMHAGLQTSLGILEPEHLYPGTREFIGFF